MKLSTIVDGDLYMENDNALLMSSDFGRSGRGLICEAGLIEPE